MLKTIRSFVRKNITATVLTLFTLVFSSLIVPQMLTQNMVGDEGVYILEGERYLHELTPSTYYYNSGSPHLLKLITSLALVPLPLNTHYESYFKGFLTDVSSTPEFTYIQNRYFSDTILFLARLPHLVIAIALGFAIYLFTKKYVGTTEAIIALCFYAFHNTFLAHAGFANLDIGTTFFTFLAFISFYIFSNKQDNKDTTKIWLLIAGVTLGIAQATKISAILLYPVCFTYYALTQRPKHWINLLAISGISFITLWALYGFGVGLILIPGQDPAGIESTYGSIPVLSEFKSHITELLKQPIYPAGAYFTNFSYQFTHQFYGHTMYINGQFLEHGAWYFMPISLWYKNSVFFIGLSILGCGAALKYGANKNLRRYILLWLAGMTIWFLFSSLQLGTRYVFPMYPQLFILTASGLAALIKRTSLRMHSRSILIAILLIYAVLNLRTYPNYFSFLNETTVLSNPINLITDSDYDWGQNIYKLQSLQREENLEPLYIRSFSPAKIGYYESNSNDIFIHAFEAKETGYYALSHSALVDLKKSHSAIFEYFRRRTPRHIIDSNIYVYYETFEN